MVTGASSGIGEAIARELARRGHGVTLVARRADALRHLATELSEAHRVRAEVIPTDLADVDDRRRLLKEVTERGLQADVLVNNAGVGTFGAVHESDPDREVAMLRTNVEALADLCSLFLPGMVERGVGAVLNVASTAAFQPMPGQAGYGGSKAFVLSYSHAIRAELRSTGVRATVLCPGPVETGFSRAAGANGEEVSKALPRFMWVGADKVARQAVKGLSRGQAVVIPGIPNHLTAVAGRLLPDQAVAWLVANRHPGLRN